MAKKYNEHYLTWEEINAIISAAKNIKDRIALKLLARTGMRRFELSNLMVVDIDFERKRIRINRGKGGKKGDMRSRIVPIDEDTLQDLKFYLQGRRSGRLIQSNRKGTDGISVSAINRIVTKCAKKAGIQNPNPSLRNMNPHIFRHSFSRLSLQEGIPFNMVQKIVGHADARTTLQMYGVPSINDTQMLYESKLGDKFHTKAQNKSQSTLKGYSEEEIRKKDQ